MRSAQIVTQDFGKSTDVKKADAVVFGVRLRPGHLRAGQPGLCRRPGLRDLTDKKDIWDIRNPDHVNGGVNHFGSPFNFPEEFVTVYRLHPLVPDLIEYRDLQKDPNQIAEQDSGDRDLPRQGDRRDALARPGQLGAQHGPPAARAAGAAESSAFLQNLKLPTPGQRRRSRSTSRRST